MAHVIRCRKYADAIRVSQLCGQGSILVVELTQKEQGVVVQPLGLECGRIHQKVTVISTRNPLVLDPEVISQSLPLCFEYDFCSRQSERERERERRVRVRVA